MCNHQPLPKKKKKVIFGLRCSQFSVLPLFKVGARQGFCNREVLAHVRKALAAVRSRSYTVPCLIAGFLAGGNVNHYRKKRKRDTKHTALQACLVTTLTATKTWERLLIVGTVIWKVPRTFFCILFIFSLRVGNHNLQRM